MKTILNIQAGRSIYKQMRLPYIENSNPSLGIPGRYLRERKLIINERTGTEIYFPQKRKVTFK